jgi:hypothetical protein
MRVLPVEGRVVRDPKTKMPLPPEGREVPDTDMFWVRRVRDGDVTVADDAPQPHAPAPAREA